MGTEGWIEVDFGLTRRRDVGVTATEQAGVQGAADMISGRVRRKRVGFGGKGRTRGLQLGLTCTENEVCRTSTGREEGAGLDSFASMI